MGILVIADTHFGHQSLAEEYMARPTDFSRKIITNWKRTVKEDDLIIHPGYVVIGDSKDWAGSIPELPGRKILVTDNP